MRRPSRMLIAALSVAATLTCSSSASAIVGGTAVPEGGFPYVANVTIAAAFGCTGTLIAPQWVLSAGHCGSITGGTGYGTPIGWPAGAITVTLGTTKADGTGGTSYVVDQVKLPTGYLLVDGYDVSLLHLST